MLAEARAYIYAATGVIVAAIGVVALIMGEYVIGTLMVATGIVGSGLAVVDIARSRDVPTRLDLEPSPTRLIGGGLLLIGLAAVFALRDASLGDLIWATIGTVLIVVGLVKRSRSHQA